jgi:hypothetical protein
MQEDEIKNWTTIKDKLVAEYPDLNKEELEYKIGQEQELLEVLQAKLKQDKKAIRSWLRMMG